MKSVLKLRTVAWILAIQLILSACGATQATSEINVHDTAIAAAFTLLAQTEAARPANTPIPPTQTPTQTPIPSETPAVTITATQTNTPSPTATSPSASGDECNKPLTSISGGMNTKLRILNETGAPITVSIFMHKTPFGDCGYRGYSLGVGDAVTITDFVIACYSVSVYVNDPKKPTKSFGYGCPNNVDRWTFFVRREEVVFAGR